MTALGWLVAGLLIFFLALVCAGGFLWLMQRGKL